MPIRLMHELKEYRVQCYVMELPDAGALNAAIWTSYRMLRDDPALKRSHYFGGRYENIYVPEERLPDLVTVLEAARGGARRFLNQSDLDLSVGFWFNEMGPGQSTLPHTHDDDDELVSGVYYLRVPKNSGDLVLVQDAASTRIVPREGMFVFFAPDVVHEVTENQSTETRLSIGMNFGIRR